MQWDNRQAILLLIALELSLELSADIIREQAANLPWPMLSQPVADGLICMVLMSLIVTAIALLEPRVIEQILISLWNKSCWVFRVLKARLTRKSTA